MIESFKEKVLKAGNDVDNIPRFLRIISEILEVSYLLSTTL